jgi:hypothetical protein
MDFTYSLCGWEGAASDARVFADAKAHDFIVPPGKYYLADTGFPVCDEILTPDCAVRYHLAEWGHAGVRWVVYMTFTNKYQAKEQGGTLQSSARIEVSGLVESSF